MKETGEAGPFSPLTERFCPPHHGFNRSRGPGSHADLGAFFNPMTAVGLLSCKDVGASRSGRRMEMAWIAPEGEDCVPTRPA